MGLAAFNRMRREAEERAKLEQESQEVVIAPEEEKEPVEGENESLTLDEVKEELDRLGVKYSHNTGEAKLREKLAAALEVE